MACPAEQVVYFFRDVMGVPVVDKAVLSKRTGEYRAWVEAFARNHNLPMEWAQKGVRKEDYVRPWLRRMERAGQYGVYFIFQSMEQGPTFRCSVPKFPTEDPNDGTRALVTNPSDDTASPFGWQSAGSAPTPGGGCT